MTPPPTNTPFDPTTTEAMPSPSVTRVTLLRHGAVETPGERVVRGQFDAALTREGSLQHESLARWFLQSASSPDRILTSDLERCRSLAALIGERAGVAVEHSEQLREQHMGDWQGRTWADIQTTDGVAINDYWDDYVNACPPNGESLAALSARVTRFWCDRADACADSHVVLVTHIGVIRCLLCHWLELPLDQALRWAPSVASSTELFLSDTGAVLSAFGERPWSFRP